MSAATEPSASWLKARNDLLSSLSHKEGETKVLPFPHHELIRLVKDKFRLEECQIVITFRGLVAAEQMIHEFGKKVLVQPLFVQPLEAGDVFLLTSEEDLQQIMEVVFSDASLASYFYEKDKLLGFHYYFMAELCKIFQECHWASSMTAKLSGDARFSTQVLEGRFQTLLISCILDSKTIQFAILIPEATYASGLQLFASQNQEIDISQINLMQSVSMAVEVGDCWLSDEEWKQVAVGSFILLDSCLYDPDNGDSGAFLSIQGVQFFGGRFVDRSSGDFKITSFPTMQKESTEDTETQNPSPSNQHRLVAEVVRYSISLDEFLKLTQGSILSLQGQHPALGVDIIFNGEKKGRGEIIAIGDVLGIRVISM